MPLLAILNFLPLLMIVLRRKIQKACQDLFYLSNDLLENVNQKDRIAILAKMRYCQSIINRGLKDIENAPSPVAAAQFRHLGK